MYTFPVKDLEFRCDDLFIGKRLTGSMKNSLRYNSFFGHFLAFDHILEQHGAHCIMTIVADGIELYPEWVAYVKRNKHRYTLQLHCWSHLDHQNLTAEEAFEQLNRGRNLIEETFDVRVSRWYVPFGRVRFPEWSLEVCKRLGLEFHTSGGTARHHYFHYWNSADRERLRGILRGCQTVADKSKLGLKP